MTAPDLASLHALLVARDAVPSLGERRANIAALAQAVRASADAIAEAIELNFGGRPRAETVFAETGMVLENIRWTSRQLRRWTRPDRVRLGAEFVFSRARVTRVPLGVVGILAPWNYPAQLALVPLVAALAGGNRVILKPSEHTPRIAALLAEIVEGSVGHAVRVARGGPEVARELTTLPLDGLFYAGSTDTGRAVMRAAAENLTPVTLELGGKCPAILLERADLGRAAEAIVAGKLLNAGQTCVAPDHVLVPRALMREVLDALRAAVARLVPDPSGPDYAAIPRSGDRARLAALLAGLEVTPLMRDMPKSPRMGLWAAIDPAAEASVMREEIFGPILPLVPYDAVAEAVAHVNARPCPLALYVFGPPSACQAVVEATRSGGAVINDTVLHVAAAALPFGGDGASGMGAYHGEEGFRTFTRPRAVLTRSRFSPVGLSRPPYGRMAERIMRYLLR